ncbi:MAG: hypothetical protein U0X75_25150 [Acidobacteriota bacterium]
MHEATPDSVRQFILTPEDFGLARASLDDLRGGSPEENAALIRAVLAGERQDAARDLVLLNAAASLLVAGLVAEKPEALALAKQQLESGAALAKLQALSAHSNRADDGRPTKKYSICIFGGAIGDSFGAIYEVHPSGGQLLSLEKSCN